MKGRGKREIPEKIRRAAASPSTIPNCENPGANRPGFERGSPWWEASRVTDQPPQPPQIPDNVNLTHLYICNMLVIEPCFIRQAWGIAAPINEHFTISWPNHVQFTENGLGFTLGQQPMRELRRLKYMQYLWQTRNTPVCGLLCSISGEFWGAVLGVECSGRLWRNEKTSGIIRHDSHMPLTPPRIEPSSPRWEGSSLTTAPPRTLSRHGVQASSRLTGAVIGRESQATASNWPPQYWPGRQRRSLSAAAISPADPYLVQPARPGYPADGTTMRGDLQTARRALQIPSILWCISRDLQSEDHNRHVRYPLAMHAGRRVMFLFTPVGNHPLKETTNQTPDPFPEPRAANREPHQRDGDVTSPLATHLFCAAIDTLLELHCPCSFEWSLYLSRPFIRHDQVNAEPITDLQRNKHRTLCHLVSGKTDYTLGQSPVQRNQGLENTHDHGV
ncbi:hypothetical protein PR048_030931 [Dryococelus australis]|uniref:Uncharacterized protein n=1 Tax=Dryococelus australis TaxID=614101 RepID=A0ABQ9GE65_9NEOP|nr:hypothetical protein PR048_030931 [Dryococelus australis]